MNHRLGVAARLVLLGLTVLASAPLAAAEPPAAAPRAQSGAPAAGKRVALVIGNSKYANFTALSSPLYNAQLMTRTLTAVGFQVTEILDANAKTQRQAVLDFGWSQHGGVEASVIYFAGLGIQANGASYTVPVDAVIRDEGDLDRQAIDLSFYLQAIAGSANMVHVVILDASRSNPFARTSAPSSRSLRDLAVPVGTLIAYSTAPGDAAEDVAGQGTPYTRALAGAMQTPGLELGLAFKRARQDVFRQSRGRQTPWELSSMSQEFYFVPRTADATRAAGGRP